MFYSRAVYALWPKRIFATDASTIINTSTQLGATTLPTDARWMNEHDIRAVVRFRAEPYGARIESTNVRIDPLQ
ncbi:MAG TPA: hypothetical protein VHD56_15230 [Tepidisphaeraceae bacterium]|nr:hypothetical protein [Tepidisphaeraceae bacterium]